MDLSDVQAQMVAGANAAMDKELDYTEATQAFQLTLVDAAVKRYDGVMHKAAMKLGISPALVSMMVHGKSHRRGRSRNKQASIPATVRSIKEGQ